MESGPRKKSPLEIYPCVNELFSPKLFFELLGHLYFCFVFPFNFSSLSFEFLNVPIHDCVSTLLTYIFILNINFSSFNNSSFSKK